VLVKFGCPTCEPDISAEISFSGWLRSVRMSLTAVECRSAEAGSRASFLLWLCRCHLRIPGIGALTNAGIDELRPQRF
jgi:hypothetical protein